MGSTEFDARAGADSRWSTIWTGAGDVIPVVHGGADDHAAAAETILRRDRSGLRPRRVRVSKFASWGWSRVTAIRDLRLVLLARGGLKRLGVSRCQLITGGSATYPVTRRWAELHAAALPQVDGLLWGSRQASGRDALLLFGACQSRPGGVARTDLRGEGPHVPLASPPGRDRLFEIGAALEVTIVAP
ncbi:MAG: RES domain-containing protein [Egibacteraceae bacterium]